MASVESLIFDIVARDRASDGITRISKAADSASGSTDSLNKRLDELGRKSAQARVELAGDKEAQAALDKIDAKLVSLDRRTASPNLKVEGAARAIAEISAVDLELDKLGGQGGTAEKATAAVGSGAGGLAGPTGMAALIGAGVLLSPIVATLSFGLAGFGLAAYGAAKPIETAATATGGLAANMGQLDPAQQAVAEGILALGKQYDAFQKALQPEVFGAFNGALTIAGHLLHDIQPVAVTTGKAFDILLSRIDAEFQSGTWQQFFGFMAQTAGPDMQQLGLVFTDLLNTLPPLLEDLQPIASTFLTLTDDAVRLTGVLAQLPSNFNNAAKAAQQQPANPLGFLQTASDFLNKLADHIPAGHKSLLDLISPAQQAGAAAAFAARSINDTALAANALAIAAKSATPPTDAENAALYATNTVAADAASSVTALNSAWSAFLGLSTSLVTAQLGVEGNLKTLTADAKITGATFTGVNDASQKLQTDFESGMVPGLQNVLNGMRKAGASSHDLATVLATDLKPAVDRGALANKALEQQIYDMAVQAGYTGPNKLKPLQDWIDKNAGSAQNAANKVNAFGAALANLPSARSLKVIMEGKGTYAIVNATTGVPYPVRAAASGMYVNAGTGPTSDDVIARVSRGELIVPARMVSSGAVDHLRGQIPGFAAGGYVSSWTMPSNLTPQFVSGMYGNFENALAAGTAKAITAGISQGQAAAIAAMGGATGGSGVARWAPVILQALAMLGQSPANLGAVEHRMAQESGGNQYAINLWDINARNGDPSRGLMQTIMATFQRYRSLSLPNDIYNPLANVYAGLHYAELAYPGRSLSSVMLQAGGYDQGGYLPPGLSLAYNGTGQPEPVGQARGGGNTYNITIHAPSGNATDIGRVLANYLGAHIKAGGRIYPAGTTPR